MVLEFWGKNWKNWKFGLFYTKIKVLIDTSSLLAYDLFLNKPYYRKLRTQNFNIILTQFILVNFHLQQGSVMRKISEDLI
jgi:hypothetical protein